MMDFRDRLLQNDFRCLSDNVRALSDELLLIRKFIKHKFGSEFKSFLYMNNTNIKTNESSTWNIKKSKTKGFKTENNKSSESDSEPTKNVPLSSRRNHKTRFTKTSKTSISKEESDSDDNDVENNLPLEMEMFEVPQNLSPLHCISLHEDENHDAPSDERETLPTVPLPTTHELKVSKIDSDIQQNSESDSMEDAISDSDPDFDISDVIITGAKSYKRKKKSQLTKTAAKRKPNLTSFCPLCRVAVPSASTNYPEFKSHVETHTKEEMLASLVCPKCYKKWKQEDKFNEHLGKCHTSAGFRQQQVCSYCGKITGDKQKRLDHERIHTGEKPFQCKTCKRNFTTMSSLKRHLRTIHP